MSDSCCHRAVRYSGPSNKRLANTASSRVRICFSTAERADRFRGALVSAQAVFEISDGRLVSVACTMLMALHACPASLEKWYGESSNCTSLPQATRCEG